MTTRYHAARLLFAIRSRRARVAAILRLAARVPVADLPGLLAEAQRCEREATLAGELLAGLAGNEITEETRN